MINQKLNCLFCGAYLTVNPFDKASLSCHNKNHNKNYYKYNSILYYINKNNDDFEYIEFIWNKHIAIDFNYNYNEINLNIKSPYISDFTIYLPKKYLLKFQSLYNQTKDFSAFDNLINKFLILK